MELSKRGFSLAAGVLIGIIIIVAGFIPLIFFLSELDSNEYGEDAACALSVLTRATSPSSAQGVVPLKCNTKKTCITSEGNDCPKQLAGEEPRVVKVNKDNAKKKIEEISAEAMWNCWKTMGEGNYDLFGSLTEDYGFDTTEPTCVICERIAVDESISLEILESVNINEYMENNKVKGLGENYISAFTKGGKVSYNKQGPVTKEAFDAKIRELNNKDDGLKIEDEFLINSNNEDKVNREMAIVFMQFKPTYPDEVLSNMLSLGGTVAGATFLSPLGIGAKTIIGNPAGATLAILTAGSAVGYGMYNSYQGQLAAPGYCGKFTTTKNGVKEGCQMVQGINYNFRDINKICPQIQGDP